MKALKKYIAILLCLVICFTNSSLGVLADSIDTVPGTETEMYPESEEGTQNVEEASSDTSPVDSVSPGNERSADNGDTGESGVYSGSNNPAEGQEVGTDDNPADSISESAMGPGLDGEPVVTNGYCGNDVQWYLYEDGTIWIFGDGAITSSPWKDSGHSSQIKSVIIGDDVTEIGSRCFDNCSNLQTVIIGDGVQTIGSWAFSGTTNLSSVTMGKGIKVISDYCFYSATERVDDLKMLFRCDPSKITLGDRPFWQLGATAYYPLGSGNPGTSTWGYSANIKWISYLEWDTDQSSPIYAEGIGDMSIVASGYCGNDVQWYLHEDGTMWIFGGGAITSSPWKSTGHSGQIKKVLIDDGVTSICESAFSVITSIESVIIGDDVTEIGSRCFDNCSNLQTVIIGDGVQTIGSWAFSGTTNLSSVTMGKSINYVDQLCFYSATERVDDLELIFRCDPSKITLGDRPFWLVRATAYYPLGLGNPGSSTWGYASNITWIPSDSIFDPNTNPSEAGKIEVLFPADNESSVDKFTSFGIVWDKSIQYTGTGSAYLYEYDTDQLVQTVPLLADDDNNSSIEHYKSDKSHDMLLLKFDNSRLELDTHYYILIDAGALEFCEYDESTNSYVALGITSEGISGKDEWDFTTNNYEYMKFDNPDDRIPLSICSVLFRPITAKKFYDKRVGTGGICYGMCYAAGAYSRDYAQLSKLCAGRDLSQLDKDAGSEGMSYSLLEYIQLAHLYQYTEAKQDEYKRNKYDDNVVSNVYNAVVDALNGGTPIQIDVSNANHNAHALLPLNIIKDDDSVVEILVYDCNKPSNANENLRAYTSILYLYRSGDTFTKFEYGDWPFISYQEIDTTLDRVTSMAAPESWSVQKTLVVSSLILLSETRAYKYIESIIDGQEYANDGKYYYWTDDTSLEVSFSDDNGEISMTDGYREIEIMSENGTNARIDLEEQTASVVSDSGEEKQMALTVRTADEDANIKSITLSGNSNTEISAEINKEGIQLTSEDDNFSNVSVTVDGNEVELNNVDFTSTKNTVTVTVDEDNTITVLEDQDEDGENETILVQKEVDSAEEETVIINSANVEFQGKIQLQFAFSFPESVQSDENAYVTFEKAGTTTKKLISEGTVSGDTVSFIIPVPATEFADDIIVKVYDGGGNQLTLKSAKGTDYTEDGFVYSVKTYADNKSQSGSTEEMRNLAKALVDYGTAAQIYFQYGDTSGLSVDGAVSAVTEDDLAPYALTVTGTKPDGVTGANIMVAFDTDNTLRITFKTDGSKPLGDYTFLLDGTEKKATKKGKNAYLQVKNIAAPNLDTPHTFTVTDGTNTYTVTASALSYAYTSVKNGDSARQNLGKALYLYNRAADAYFGS